MWPWEHALVAYVGYSLLSRSLRGRPPGEPATILVIVGSQIPDLIDKPLAWWIGLIPAGRSLTHSLLVAGPIVLVVLVVFASLRRSELGIAFGVGYLSHLVGDVVYPVMLGEQAETAFLLYPLVPVESEPAAGLIARTTEFLQEFVVFLGTPRGLAYVIGEIGLVVLAVWLWLADGKPGLGIVPRTRSMLG